MRTFFLALCALGCSSSDNGNDGGSDAAQTSDVVMMDSPADSSSAQTATFSYKPQWSGVKKVEVVGGFGQASDWSKTLSLISLTNDGTGKWTGTAQLPTATYLYVFRVTGDDDSTQGAAFVHYAIDPLNTAYAACPMQSPTFSMAAPNPCSQLTVPQGAQAAQVHVKGQLFVRGATAVGWIVEIEREEQGSHHFFVNRVRTDSI